MNVLETSEKERFQVFRNLLITIALEETGLSHIINAEGEKIQAISYGIVTGLYSEYEAEEIEKSVNKVIEVATQLQILLHYKLETIMDAETEFKKIMNK